MVTQDKVLEMEIELSMLRDDNDAIRKRLNDATTALMKCKIAARPLASTDICGECGGLGVTFTHVIGMNMVRNCDACQAKVRAQGLDPPGAVAEALAILRGERD